MASALAIAGCDAQFTPHITPLVIPTIATEQLLETVEADSTIAPSALTGTAESAMQATLEAISTQIAGNKAGDVETAFYEEVICDDLSAGARCFKLCIRGECEVFPNDEQHTRVQTFIDAVDRVAEEQEKIEDASFRDAGFSIAALTTCGGAVMTLALVDPEPYSKALLSLAGVIVAFGTCGGSFLGMSHAGDDIRDSSEIIDNELLNAEGQFRLLQIGDSNG